MTMPRVQKVNAKVATLIAGGPPPVWLRPGLDRVIQEALGPAIASQENVEDRADIADRIEKVIGAVRLLRKNLGSQSVVGIELAGGGPGPALEDDEEMRQEMLGLKARAESALRRLRQPGRDKIHRGSHPKIICATTIAVAWHMTRNAFPTPSSKAACQAAEILWETASGPPSMYDNVRSGIGGWRRYFQEVLKSNLAPDLLLLRGRIWHKLQSD
jgi:hypothetical protein